MLMHNAAETWKAALALLAVVLVWSLGLLRLLVVAGLLRPLVSPGLLAIIGLGLARRGGLRLLGGASPLTVAGLARRLGLLRLLGGASPLTVARLGLAWRAGLAGLLDAGLTRCVRHTGGVRLAPRSGSRRRQQLGHQFLSVINYAPGALAGDAPVVARRAVSPLVAGQPLVKQHAAALLLAQLPVGGDQRRHASDVGLAIQQPGLGRHARL